MYAIEFEAKPENGSIQIPEIYRKRLGGKVRVIILEQTAPRRESELLLQINRTLDQARQERFGVLMEKRRAEDLTAEEHRELLVLTEQTEALQAQRMRALAELAEIRAVPLRQVMQDLGIRPRA
jgi:hypothetical protein